MENKDTYTPREVASILLNYESKKRLLGILLEEENAILNLEPPTLWEDKTRKLHEDLLPRAVQLLKAYERDIPNNVEKAIGRLNSLREDIRKKIHFYRFLRE